MTETTSEQDDRYDFYGIDPSLDHVHVINLQTQVMKRDSLGCFGIGTPIANDITKLSDMCPTTLKSIIYYRVHSAHRTLRDEFLVVKYLPPLNNDGEYDNNAEPMIWRFDGTDHIKKQGQLINFIEQLEKDGAFRNETPKQSRRKEHHLRR